MVLWHKVIIWLNVNNIAVKVEPFPSRVGNLVSAEPGVYAQSENDVLIPSALFRDFEDLLDLFLAQKFRFARLDLVFL